MAPQNLAKRPFRLKLDIAAMASALEAPPLGICDWSVHARLPSWSVRFLTLLLPGRKASPEVTASHAGAAMVACRILVEMVQEPVQVEQMVGDEMQDRLLALDAADHA